MNQLKSIEMLKRRAPGQKVCSKCLNTYNNRVLPKYCQCGEHLGGSYVPKETKSTDSHLVTRDIASVRTNKRGVPTRTFVDVTKNRVSATGYN